MFDACMHILNVYFEDGPYNEPGARRLDMVEMMYLIFLIVFFIETNFNRSFD